MAALGQSNDNKENNETKVEVSDSEEVKHAMAASSAVVYAGEKIIRQLPLKKINLESDATSKFEIGPKKKGVTEKVMLTVGETGSGKTRLLDSMVNYIMCVDFNDNFRFRLVPEDAMLADQAVSQTQSISVYTINHQEGYNIPYTLTVIDTPGFGDTTGIKRDEEVTAQIHNFLSTIGDGGIDHIDAIGFVINSTQTRLTKPQIYVHDLILSLFGKNIADNIFLLFTFADDNRPPVLTSIQEADVPYKKWYKFNSSVLFPDSYADIHARGQEGNIDSTHGNDDILKRAFWSVCMDNYKKYFNMLCEVEPKSLQLTRAVLTERAKLKSNVNKFELKISCGLDTLDKIQREMESLSRNRSDMEIAKDYTYTDTEEVIMETPIFRMFHTTTTCMLCKHTCDPKCVLPFNGLKRWCHVMLDGNCQICPGKCHWSDHKHIPYIISKQIKQVRKVMYDMKDRHDEAQNKKSSVLEQITKLKVEYNATQMEVIHLADQVRVCMERIQSIALRPDTVSVVDYIDILMQKEKMNAKPGWGNRIEQLQGLRKSANFGHSLDSLQKT